MFKKKKLTQEQVDNLIKKDLKDREAYKIFISVELKSGYSFVHETYWRRDLFFDSFKEFSLDIIKNNKFLQEFKNLLYINIEDISSFEILEVYKGYIKQEIKQQHYSGGGMGCKWTWAKNFTEDCIDNIELYDLENLY